MTKTMSILKNELEQRAEQTYSTIHGANWITYFSFPPDTAQRKKDLGIAFHSLHALSAFHHLVRKTSTGQSHGSPIPSKQQVANVLYQNIFPLEQILTC